MSTLGTGRASCTYTPLPPFLVEVPGAESWGRHRQCRGQGPGGSTGWIPLPSLYMGSQVPPGDKHPPGHNPAHWHHRSPWPAHPEPSQLGLGHLRPFHLLLARPQPAGAPPACRLLTLPTPEASARRGQLLSLLPLGTTRPDTIPSAYERVAFCCHMQG